VESAAGMARVDAVVVAEAIVLINREQCLCGDSSMFYKAASRTFIR